MSEQTTSQAILHHKFNRHKQFSCTYLCTLRSYLDFEHVIGISPQAPQDVAWDADIDLISLVGTDGCQEAIYRGGGRGDDWGTH